VGLDLLQSRPDPILIEDGDKKKANLLFIQNVAYMLHNINE
jgi:hypothetical protein